MAAEESVSEWIALAKYGEGIAAERLYDRYFHQLLEYARPRINQRNRSLACEEDVAQSVLNIFCHGVQNGRFDYIRNRVDLWQVLIRITVHKIIDYHRRFGTGRTGAREIRVSEIESYRENALGMTLEPQYAEESLEPAMLARLQDEFRLLLKSLRTDESRRIAVMRLEGNSIQEIADAISKSTRSVERKLQSIRQRWVECLSD